MAAAVNGARQWADGPFPLIKSPAVDGDYTDPFTAAATHMSIIHNLLIRGLNAIYIQSPHVLPADHSDFIGYCQSWSEFLHQHHTDEESTYFPKIEAATGVPGIMEPNVSQHASFSPALTAFDQYLSSSSSTPGTFSGPRLVELIDGFGQLLTQHLADEIPTILGLRTYGAGKVDIMAFDEEQGKHAMKVMGKTTAVPFLITGMDVTYEGGIHKDFPPAPGVVKALARALCPRFNRGFWRFAPCDSAGRPRVMHAAPPVLEGY